MRTIRSLTAISFMFMGICGFSTAAAEDAGSASDTVHTVISGGLKRSYLLHLPAKPAAGTALALVIGLHGGLGSGKNFRHMTGFDALADAKGFIVAYPDGMHRHWADGRGVNWADQHGVDDVAFISSLIDDVERIATVDTRRVYATGISNGGLMCERLGLELGARIAAIAPVAGNMPTALAQSLPAAIPAMPVLIMNGTADQLMPYDGGVVAGDLGTVLSVDATIALWRTLNHVERLGQPIATTLPDLDQHDGCTVDEAIYPGQQRTQVVLCKIIGGGHTWPSEPPDMLISRGLICRDISASAKIWEFFAAHPKDAPGH